LFLRIDFLRKFLAALFLSLFTSASSVAHSFYFPPASHVVMTHRHASVRSQQPPRIMSAQRRILIKQRLAQSPVSVACLTPAAPTQ
jgi:hypothetical protein